MMRFYKIFLFLLIFYNISCGALPFYKVNSFFTKKELEYIKNKKVLNVYILVDYPPFYKNESPQITGYLKKYANLIANIVGWKVKYYYKYNDNIDMINAVRKTKRNQKKYIFIQKSVYDVNLGIVCIKKDKKRFTSNEKIAVIKDCLYLNALKKRFPNIKYIECKTNFDAIKLLLRKKVSAAIGNYFDMSYLVEKHFLSGLSVSLLDDIHFSSIHQHLAFKKNDILLKNIIKKIINHILDEEQLYFLRKKWLKNPYKEKIFLTKKEKKFLKNHIVKIALTPSWPPINSINKKGEIIGIGLDYWKLIAKKANIKYKIYKLNSFTEVVNSIKNKKYDINIATSKTLDKESFSLFSKIYEKFPIAIATLNNDHFITSGVELKNKKVAVGKSYSTYFLLKDIYPNINFVFTNTTKDALVLVAEKKAFAAVDIEPVLRYQILDNNFKNINITGITGVDFNMQIIIREDYKILKSIIDKSISNISNKEKIEIYKKWIGLQDEHISIDFVLIWKVAAISFLIIALLSFAYYKQKKLKNQIEKLNQNLKNKIVIATEKNKKDQFIMLQQSRLAQMGEIISMIAHQWRQPLNTISLINSTILAKYKNNNLSLEEMEGYFIKSKKVISQMSKTIDDFRNFFKPDKKKSYFSIKSIIENSLAIVEPTFKAKNINIILNIESDFTLYGYPNELRQAIINILNNAKDALIESGKKSKNIKIDIYNKENKIFIDIEDNGIGIKKENIKNIFDPYFSTKTNKNGTGLGLYMTKVIIEDHLKGKIDVHSSDNGALFKIILGGMHENKKT